MAVTGLSRKVATRLAGDPAHGELFPVAPQSVPIKRRKGGVPVYATAAMVGAVATVLGQRLERAAADTRKAEEARAATAKAVAAKATVERRHLAAVPPARQAQPQRQPTGSTARRPGARHVRLHLQLLDDRRIRVSTPEARGWAACVRGPEQLWQATQAAFREATIAGYAVWKGERPELDALTEADDPTEPAPRKVASADELYDRAQRKRATSWARDAISRPDVTSPSEDWTPNPDGTWTSKSGQVWQASAGQVQRMLAKRRRLGLATSYEELYGTGTGEAQ